MPPWVVEVPLYGATAVICERTTGVPGSYERCLDGGRGPLDLRLDVPEVVRLEFATRERRQGWVDFHAKLPATSILWHEPELLAGQLQTCAHLLRDIPAFELSWSPGTGVAGEVLDLMRRSWPGGMCGWPAPSSAGRT